MGWLEDKASPGAVGAGVVVEKPVEKKKASTKKVAKKTDSKKVSK